MQLHVRGPPSYYPADRIYQALKLIEEGNRISEAANAFGLNYVVLRNLRTKMFYGQ